MNILVISTLCVCVLVLGYFAWQYRNAAASLKRRYAGIINVQAEVASSKTTLAETKRSLERFQSEQQQRRSQLVSQIEETQARYAKLQADVNLLEENLEDISFGLYKPHFNFATSEEYKSALETLRDKEREMIRAEKAVISGVKWTVGNSEKEGKRMAKQYTKVMLRAFNGECDAAVANVTWNNITKMEERLRKSADAINQLGSVMHFSLTPDYVTLKLDELRLTHEYENKRNEERQEEKRIRDQIRDEERAQREMEKAKEKAEQEEADYQQALNRAREEAMRATGEQLEKLTPQVKSLETKVDEARQNKQRAIARAQLTKSGFVYVISNIGSFGERVFKIGMTRRLEPMDRIEELSSASVPFPFDLHAMLFSDNAPELETALHRLVQDRQVNLVNSQKEFYHDVDLSEIEAFVKAKGVTGQFTPYAEAKQYRETLVLRQQRAAGASAGS